MNIRIISIAAIVASVASASCGGEDDDSSQQQPPLQPSPTAPPPVPTQPPAVAGTPQAKQFFIETVYPSLVQTCGSCHIEGRAGAPRWLGADANTAYDQIKAHKSGALVGPIASNLLLLKEPHQGGQQLSAQQKGLVQQWLQLEYNGEVGGAPSQTFSQALENFAGCMSFNDWDGRGLDDLPLVPVAVDGVDVQAANCETCHLNAAQTGSVLLSADDAQATFDNFRIFPAIIKLVSAAGFPFQQLIGSDRLIEKGNEYRNCVVDNDLLDLVAQGDLNNPEYCHPNYIVDEDAEDQLEFFIDNTIAIAKAGNCAIQGQ
jgi:hypothetical protein